MYYLPSRMATPSPATIAARIAGLPHRDRIAHISEISTIVIPIEHVDGWVRP